LIVNLLISTINNRILGLKNIVLNKPNIIYTISHQIIEKLSDDTEIYLKELKKNKQVIYSQINSKGVARNRNNALKHRVKGSICLLCDDDVIYFEDSYLKIIDVFKEEKSIDFLTFKIKTFKGKDYKTYKGKRFNHTLKSLSNIGIIDVAFREEVIEKYNLSFDERFGPCGYYSIGEDFIFMTDAIKKKAFIQYRPIDIVQHEDIGTGQILRDDIIFGRGAMFARVFGLLSFPLNIYFSVKNLKKYNKKYTFIKYNQLLLSGSIDFLRKKDWSQ
jgi:hypothetical protein